MGAQGDMNMVVRGLKLCAQYLKKQGLYRVLEEKQKCRGVMRV